MIRKLWRKLFPVKVVHVAESDYNPIVGMVRYQGEILILNKYGRLWSVRRDHNNGLLTISQEATIDVGRP